METRLLGPSSLSVAVVGLGCNNLGRLGTASEDQKGSNAVVGAAIEAGVTFFDTADIYGAEYGLSETRLGAAIKGSRDQLVIATKFGHTEFPSPLPGRKGSRDYIRAAVEGSLRRLGTDRIDLYQQHTPDPSVPIDETLGALDELVREGKVLEIGNSNFTAEQIAEADAVAERRGTARFISAQNEYNLLARSVEVDILPAVRAARLGFLPFFPLANGLFTGKFTRSERPADSRISRTRPHVADDAPWNEMEAYAAFCAARGISMLEATFGWLLSRPGLTSVIAGATKPEQITQNASAGSGWRPSPAEAEEIEGLFPLS
ncbi:MAG TPA: aldo/keto reductase [Pseudolysinimonas sp.]|nr:aldo/keto reductase [Pseudolysinimonas sp.]